MYRARELFDQCGKCNKVGALKVFNPQTLKAEISCIYCYSQKKKKGWPRDERRVNI